MLPATSSTCIVHSSLLCSMASYDMASKICQARCPHVILRTLNPS